MTGPRLSVSPGPLGSGFAGARPQHAVLLALVVLAAGCGREPLVDLGPGLIVDEPIDVSTSAPDAAPPVSTAGELLPVPVEDDDRYRIRTGDVLTISVFGEPELTRKLPVGPDGRISYYIANDVVAAGRTFEELRAELRERLLTHFRDPSVAVFGEAYTGNTASVLGMVRRPGEYVVRSGTRVLDVLAMAGGLSRSSYRSYRGIEGDLPDLSRAFMLREDRFVSVDFERLFENRESDVARNNVIVRAGDRVYIPSATSLDNKVIVLGEVRSPRVVRFQRDISFLEATAEAGGILPAAWERRAFIVRGSLRRPRVIPVNLRKVAVGVEPDVPLESGDIVYVPKTVLGKISEVARQVLPLLQDAEHAKYLSE